MTDYAACPRCKTGQLLRYMPDEAHCLQCGHLVYADWQPPARPKPRQAAHGRNLPAPVADGQARGAEFRCRRLALGLTLHGLAALVGRDQTHLGEVERGQSVLRVDLAEAWELALAGRERAEVRG